MFESYCYHNQLQLCYIDFGAGSLGESLEDIEAYAWGPGPSIKQLFIVEGKLQVSSSDTAHSPVPSRGSQPLPVPFSDLSLVFTV